MNGHARQHSNAGRTTYSRWDPNHVFGRLGIRTKLTIAFLLLAGTPLAVVGWYAANQHLRSLRAAATAEQRRQLGQMQRQVETLLIAIGEDMDFLASSRTIGAVIGPAGRVESVESAGLALLGDILVSKPYYYRVRLLAPDGSEVLHVVRTSHGPTAMPSGKWRGTGYRYYRELIDAAGPDMVPFSPVEIRSPTDTGQVPTLVSSISFARAIESLDMTGTSLLVADIYASALLGLLEAEATEPDRRIMLVGPSGHFLYHSSVKMDWNTLLARQGGRTLAQEFGDDIAEEVLSRSEGLIGDSHGWVIAYARVFGEARTHGGSYRLVSAVTEDVAFAPARRVSRVILVVGVLTLLLAGGLAFAAAHQFTAPIRQLRHGAARVAAGDFTAAVSVATNDELEDLGRSFVAMAKALEVRESELVRRQTQLQTLFDTMGEGVAVVRATGEVVFMNRFLRERFGVPDGRPVTAVFGVGEQRCDDCRGVGLISDGPCECRQGEASDGRCYEVLGVRLADFEGSPAVLEIHRDVTQRRAMERQIEQYTEQLESMVESRTRELRESQAQMIQQEKMVAVGQLAAGVAHELGTPLAAILCHGEMALEELAGVEGSGEARESLRTVVGQTERTRQIVRSLLDFSRPSSGEREPVRLSDVVASVGSLLQHDFQRRDIELVVADTDRPLTVLANRNELEQLVVNLVRNAADAMPGGGQVCVTIESTASHMCEILVQDQGSGIAAADRGRVFEPFFTTKPPGQGTGLGLWVSYNIAREYGGKLEVRRTGADGTTMVVELPLSSSTGEAG